MAPRRDPTFSVIMPVYNGEQHLAQALDSLLMQTYGDFEVVAVDDGSVDRSWDILRRYAAVDERVRPHRLAQNHGHRRASNIAVERARGRFVARQDQDDLALPRRLELTALAFERFPHVGFVYSSYLRWLPDGSLSWRPIGRSHTALRLRLLFGNVICHSSVAMRREVFEKLDGPYRDIDGPQDYDVWVRALRITESFGIHEPLAVYRQETMAMTELYGDRIDVAAGQISREQLLELVPAADAASVARARSIAAMTVADRRAVGALHEVYREALARDALLDPSEVSRIRGRWTAKALHSMFARAGRPPDPRLLWQVVKNDPSGSAQWLRADLAGLWQRMR